MDPWLIALFVLASVGGTALIAFAISRGAAHRKAQAEMAVANGWRYDHQASGGVSETIISDPEEGWRLTIHSYSGGSGSSSGSTGSSVRWTMFEDPSLRIQGMAVLGPDIPEKTAAMADKFMGMMGGDLGRWFLDKITGGLGEEAANLRSVADDRPGHLMATPDAEQTLDDIRLSPELHNARAGKNEAQQPIVMRGPFGMRVRVQKRLSKPKEIEDFVRLGRALSDNLRTG